METFIIVFFVVVVIGCIIRSTIGSNEANPPERTNDAYSKTNNQQQENIIDLASNVSRDIIAYSNIEGTNNDNIIKVEDDAVEDNVSADKDSPSIEDADTKIEYTKVNQYLFDKYMGGWNKDTVIFLIRELHLNHKEYALLPTEIVIQAKKEYNLYKKDESELNKCSELNIKGIELEKSGDIDKAIEVYEENIKSGYPAAYSYERLMILYHKQKDYENEKRIIRAAITVFSKENEKRGENVYNIIRYKNRLEKLMPNKNKKTNLPKHSDIYIPDGEPLGIKFQQTIKDLPEFNFYYDLNKDESTLDYLYRNSERVSNREVMNVLWDINDKFKKLRTEASNLEQSGDFDAAAKIYEQIVGEKYWNPLPYDRLIIIYAKAKLKEDEIRVLEYSIDFFKQLELQQREYILSLAKKYGKLDFAEQRIKDKKKITYFAGFPELYNPFVITEKWENRLLMIRIKNA